ncbi:MAG: hypothetical protein VB957_08430 [Pseudomonadales bacterium]
MLKPYSTASSPILRGFILLAFSFCLLPCSASSDDAVTDYFFQSISFSDRASTRLSKKLENAMRNENPDLALELAEELVNDNERLSGTHPIRYGMLLANVGILLSDQGLYAEGIGSLDIALQFIESRANPFSETIFKIAMARGLTLIQIGFLEDAEQAFRRAQHITHRTDGVYSINQLNIINHLAQLNIDQGKFPQADREQEFNLRISEQAYGKESEEMLPILQRLGAYFASRGRMLPLTDSPEIRYMRDSRFRQSLELYSRAIKIIEDNYGVNDIRLLEPLHGIANTRLMENKHRGASEQALERALSIVESNPITDFPDHVKAIVDLGDIYTITGDGRANDLYLRAWQLMQDEPGQQELSADLFGTPTRLYPEAFTFYLSKTPDAATPVKGEEAVDVELFIDVQYSIRANGRVHNIKLIRKNVPNSQMRLIRSWLSSTRFRPRIFNGELVATENLMIHQTFQLDPNRSFTSDSYAN